MTNIMTLNGSGKTRKINTPWYDIRNYLSYNIPILHLEGSIAGMNKDVKVSLNYIWGERSGTCTLKWQGSSSIYLDKKNFTIEFDNAFEVVSGWGSQKKYCLKANFVDPSHARNIISAKLWGEIVKSRTPANTILNALPNGGAVDGFPIIISLNGKFHGLYTWNIPKEGWMFGMSGTDARQAILCADNYDESNLGVGFKGLATFENDFDLEYSSDDESAWVLESVNRLITAVKDSDGTNITYGITPYLDWESAIDYYIFTVLTANYDGIWRNYLLSTHDGIKWFFTAYDIDHTFMLRAMGKYFYDPNTSVTFADVAGMHKVFELIWKYMRPQLRARYNELRASVMSECNLTTKFCDFASDIPLPIFVDDVRLWQTIPSSAVNDTFQILNAYRLRVIASDEWIQNTSGETELPEQVNPNAPTLSSISTTYSGGNVTVGTALTELSGITVTATYSDGSTANVTDYILSGEIKEGNNTITVTYEGMTTTFTVTGVVEYTYTNQMPISIDTDGSVFNGTGYMGGKRLSSSGATKDQANAGVTGFVPVKANDNVRFKDDNIYLIWNEGDESLGSNAIAYYDEDFAMLGVHTQQPAYYGICTAENSTVTGSTKDDGIVQFVVPDDSSIAYMRISMSTNQSDGSGFANLILTVNEEIV